MRAEIQAQVADDIKKSPGALLRRDIFDWEAATRRLAELNAQAEDPQLWNDPATAQTLLRERTRLDQAIGGYRRIEREVEGGPRGADRAWRGRGAKPQSSPRPRRRCRSCARRRQDASSKACCRAKPIPMTAISKSMPGRAAPRRRIGPRCCCGCMPAGRMHVAIRSSGSKRAAARKRGSNRPPSRSADTTPMAGSKPKAPSIGSSASRRSIRTPAAADELRLGHWVYPVVDDKIEVEINDKDLRIGHLSLIGSRRAARQQDRQCGADHPYAERDCRAVPERTLAAPEPGPRLRDAARQAL